MDSRAARAIVPALSLALMAGAVAACRDASSVANPSEREAPLRAPAAASHALLFIEAETARARLRFAPTVTADQVRGLVETVDEDVASVERAYGRRFERPPAIYLFGSSAELAAGLRDAFGYSAGTSDRLARSFEGVFLPERRVIALDLDTAMRRHPFTLLRHELSHAMLFQIVGPDGRARVPAWFDEGLARLVERTAPDATFIAARDRSRALALAARGSVPSLAELARHETWSGRGAEEVEARYVISAAVVELIERELAREGVLRLLSLVGAGRPFDEAYAEVSGRSIVALAESLPSSLAGLGPFPAIAVAESEDPYVRWMAYGFPAGSPLTVRISGERYSVEYAAQSDGDGTLVGTFGRTAPPGSYTLEVVATDRSARTSLRSP